MSCKICINEENIKTMYNDCIIESLEKIKFHYMSLKGKLNENEILTNSLKGENDKLKMTVREYEELERNDSKKRRTASCEDDNDSEISFSQQVVTKAPVQKSIAKTIAQKSAEDLNTALNFEEEFELSFIPNTQIEIEEKKKAHTTSRQPLKALPVKSLQTENKQLNNIKQETNKNKEKDDNSDKNASLKKTSSWISKENEFKKITLASVQKRSNRSLRHTKQELKPKNMSLKPGKLRQTRLQLDVSKNMSTNFSDTTFCDEAIDSSPNADFSLKRINSSKQWQLRNISSKRSNSDDDSLLDLTNPSPNKSTSQSPKNKSLETSSVVMCTPASQEIIFLDETCESFNIESMDLLKDLINPTESLSNLRRIESERIKMLQKTNGGHDGYPNKYPNLDEKQNNKITNIKSEHEFAKPKVVEKDERKKPLIPADKPASKENHSHDNNNKPHGSPLKADKEDNVKKARIFDIDCNECQTYIKYLGAHLTNEEIQQHIRNCTNHKKRIDANLTPDGFWDPIIQPFASDDPRNATLIDDRFINKKS